MTGLPNFNYEAFMLAENALRAAGYQTLNPARHGETDQSKEWQYYMRLAVIDVANAEGVATLPNWYQSRGALVEVHLAASLGMPVLPVKDWFDPRVSRPLPLR